MNKEDLKDHILNTLKKDVLNEVELDPADPKSVDPLYTVSTMVKLFNAIRSGKSFNDKDVVKQLNDWWDTKPKEELQDFIFRLANITKIISPEIEPGEAGEVAGAEEEELEFGPEGEGEGDEAPGEGEGEVEEEEGEEGEPVGEEELEESDSWDEDDEGEYYEL
tara:strand:+ start:4833 stop:5324 length:492 start_codon:yes stop_codon:yes gene_type:complete